MPAADKRMLRRLASRAAPVFAWGPCCPLNNDADSVTLSLENLNDDSMSLPWAKIRKLVKRYAPIALGPEATSVFLFGQHGGGEYHRCYLQDLTETGATLRTEDSLIYAPAHSIHRIGEELINFAEYLLPTQVQTVTARIPPRRPTKIGSKKR